MFTGIIEVLGRVEELRTEGTSARLVVRAPELVADLRIGDSVAVNGVCLTVTECRDGRLGFDAVAETLEKTALGELQVGSEVNLERAMRAGGRLDGHIVQGHVDGTGTVRSLEQSGEDVRLTIDCEGDSTWDSDGNVTCDGDIMEVRGGHMGQMFVEWTTKVMEPVTTVLLFLMPKPPAGALGL